MELLDPTSEQMPEGRQPQPRLSKIDGAVIGLLDISKPRGNIFLDRIEVLLNEHGAITKRFRKPTLRALRRMSCVKKSQGPAMRY